MKTVTLKLNEANQQKGERPREGTDISGPLFHTFRSPTKLKSKRSNISTEDLVQTCGGPVLAVSTFVISCELCSLDLEDLALLVSSIPSGFYIPSSSSSSEFPKLWGDISFRAEYCKVSLFIRSVCGSLQCFLVYLRRKFLWRWLKKALT